MAAWPRESEAETSVRFGKALHRVRERLISQRIGIINQIRAFLLERGIAVQQGLGETVMPRDTTLGRIPLGGAS